MKYYALLAAALAACTQQRPVVLAPVRMETPDVLDIGIDSVSQTAEGQTFATIALRRNTSVPFPVRLRVAYADGTTQDFSLPVNIWAQGNPFDAVVPVRGTGTGVRLWPDPSVPDWNASNDTWGSPPPANPAGSVTRK